MVMMYIIKCQSFTEADKEGSVIIINYKRSGMSKYLSVNSVQPQWKFLNSQVHVKDKMSKNAQDNFQKEGWW